MKKLLLLAVIATGLAAYDGACHLYFGWNLFGDSDWQGWWWYCW